jgi:hypothetical protein
MVAASICVSQFSVAVLSDLKGGKFRNGFRRFSSSSVGSNDLGLISGWTSWQSGCGWSKAAFLWQEGEKGGREGEREKQELVR